MTQFGNQDFNNFKLSLTLSLFFISDMLKRKKMKHCKQNIFSYFSSINIFIIFYVLERTFSYKKSYL